MSEREVKDELENLHFSDSLALRLSPKIIMKELVFFGICFVLFLMLGNDHSTGDSDDVIWLVAHIPLMIGIWKFLKASYWSMIPGILCILLSVILGQLRPEMNIFHFITPKEINYLLIFGLVITPMSFLNSF